MDDPAVQALAGALVELMTADEQGRDVLQVLHLCLPAVQEHRYAVLLAHGSRGVVGMVGDGSIAVLHCLADPIQPASSQLEPVGGARGEGV